MRVSSTIGQQRKHLRKLIALWLVLRLRWLASSSLGIFRVYVSFFLLKLRNHLNCQNQTSWSHWGSSKNKPNEPLAGAEIHGTCPVCEGSLFIQKNGSSVPLLVLKFLDAPKKEEDEVAVVTTFATKKGSAYSCPPCAFQLRALFYLLIFISCKCCNHCYFVETDKWTCRKCKSPQCNQAILFWNLKLIWLVCS